MSSSKSKDDAQVQVPLISDDARADLEAAYGTGWHAKWVKPAHGDLECLIDYEPLMMSSFRICCARKGTILENPVLFTEQLILFAIFIASAAPVWWCFKEDFHNNAKGGISVRRFLAEQENKMRQFSLIMTGLAAFLLSFYTSIIVARWWAMRTGGVGGIKTATVDLQMLLYQSVTQEPKILDAVRRYGRTSLFLIFMWRRGQVKDNEVLKGMLLKRGLLDEHECDQLIKWKKHCLHETIWAWQMAIVNKLYQQGKIKSDQLYTILLGKCLDGRQAVQLAHTHLAVRVPMQYVHLLGLLVKMHNFVLALIMGLLFGAAVRNQQWVLCIQLTARVCILPFLFNAILLINCDLADPFDGSEADFPGDIYQENLGKDCSGMIGATDNIPDFLKVKQGV